MVLPDHNEPGRDMNDIKEDTPALGKLANTGAMLCYCDTEVSLRQSWMETIADHIRAMNDLELAKQLCIGQWKPGEVQECLEWLHQPYESSAP